MSSRPGRPAKRDRGQTAQDFALGISIFLLTLSFVIGFFPTVLEPYDAGAGAAESALGNRAAEKILSEVGSGRAPNDVNSTAAGAYFSRNLSAGTINENLSIPNAKFVNVTITTLNRSSVLAVTDPSGAIVELAGGHAYDGAPAVTVTRVVTMRDDVGACRPACRLIVRVW